MFLVFLFSMDCVGGIGKAGYAKVISPDGDSLLLLNKRSLINSRYYSMVTKRYNKPVIVRVTGEELINLRSRAKANEMSLSRYLVEAGLAKDKVLTPQEREREERAIFHVRKVGVNLNQIARALNRKEGIEDKRILKAIEEQKETLRILREIMMSR